MADYNKMTDEELVETTRKENVDAYEEIVKRYEKKLLRYTDYLIKDTFLAENVVQNTFLKAYKNLNGFDTKKKFSSWIYRVAHNESINELKKLKRFIKSGNETILEFFESKQNIEVDFEREELGREVRKCITKLPTRYSEVLILFFLEEKSYEEISDILRIPTGTVGTRMNRGKKLLKEICEKEKIR